MHADDVGMSEPRRDLGLALEPHDHLGVEQIGCVARESLRERASALPVWWRWTVWLGHALLWTTHDMELARIFL